MDRPSGPRPLDRRGWVGGGSMDTSASRMMAGSMSPQGGMNHQVRIQGWAPGGRAPPTLGFEAPKLSIFGPYLIFP